MYDNAECNQFSEDMEAAGFEVKHYDGRGNWHGPAVMIDRDQEHEVIRATAVALQSDHMGKGLVLYPRKSGKLVEA